MPVVFGISPEEGHAVGKRLATLLSSLRPQATARKKRIKFFVESFVCACKVVRMPRPLCLKVPGGIYHGINHGLGLRVGPSETDHRETIRGRIERLNPGPGPTGAANPWRQDRRVERLVGPRRIHSALASG